MKIRHIGVVLLLIPLFSFAQTDTPPSAGLTPQSPFYFLDKLGESLQELLAFSPEAKIRIQIGFAAERIAEIQIDMEAKDVEARGLAIAQERLQSHLAKASKIVTEERGKGNDVSEWEEALKDEFEVSKQVLESSFESVKDALEDEREGVKRELEVAKKAGDTNRVEALTETLNDLEDEKDNLEQEREERKRSLEDEREGLDDLEEELDSIGEDLEEIEVEIEVD